jgi:phosphoglycerate kinase
MKVILPTDVTVRGSDASVAVMPPGRIPPDATILDAGPQTIAGYRPIIGKAGAILWSGRFGAGEGPDSMDSSTAIARAIAGSSAFSLAIGQGVVDTIRTLGLEKGFDMVCTGETAAMRMLEGKTLPALAALGLTAGKNR